MKTFLLLFCCGVAWAQPAHQHHPPRSVTEYAEQLEADSRTEWQQPEKVIEALALRPDEVVADIGAGTGYFSRRIARRVSHVYAVDIEAEILRQAAASSPENVETVLAAPDDPKLPPASVDTIFICNVLHHVEGREAYYEKLTAALKPGGRIVIVDFFKKELPVGPPPAMKLTPGEVVAELEKAGFEQAKSHEFLAYQYFLEFTRR